MKEKGNKLYFEPYHPDKLDEHQQYLEMLAEQGTPKDFEIHINNKVAVQRTSDIEKFDNYLPFVNERTKSISLMIYRYASKQCRAYDKYLFTISYGNAVASESLSGLDTAQPMYSQKDIDRLTKTSVEEAVAKFKQEVKTEALEKQIKAYEAKIAELQKELKEVWDYAADLSAENQQLKKNKGKITDAGAMGVLQEIGKGIASKNKTLSGLINFFGGEEDESGEEHHLAGTEKEETVKASFQPKETNNAAAETDATKAAAYKDADAINQLMKQELSPEQINKANLLMVSLLSNPEKIDSIPHEMLQ
jgi:regulator of replication initiation timing